MPHVLISGTTTSGKTALAKQLSAAYKARGIESIVLDPLNDPGWTCAFQTRDPEEFLRVAKDSEQCALFVDEGGQSIGRWSGHLQWLGTMARHWGHRSHFLCQRPTQIDRNIRDQCIRLFLFSVSEYDAKTISDDFGWRELRNANELAKLEYYACGRFEKPEKRILTFD